MNRKLLFLSMICLMCFCAYVPAQNRPRPNIVMIVADDLGWGDVGFNGSDMRTPHLNQLAKEGVILNRYYVSPICSPTRAGLMTGRYPDHYGLRDNVIAPWLDFGIDTTEQFLPQLLATAGYKNRAAIGKWYLGHAARKYLPLNRGFTHFYGHYNGAIDYFTLEREGERDWHNDWETSYDKGYSTDLISREAVSCITKYKEAGPFFLYIAYNAPHGPLQAKDEDLLQYGYDPARPVFGEGKGKKEKGRGNTRKQTYAAMVSAMDEGIGQVLSALKDAGLEKNTLVLFHSNNGAETSLAGSSGGLKGGKFQEWEGGVRAPAVIKWPAGFNGGWVCNQLSGYVDVLPTLCAAAGVKVKPAKSPDGINILPALTDRKNISRAFYLGHGSMLADDWKLVKANGGNEKMKLAADMLFNIVKDPQEKNDLRKVHPDRYAQLLNAVKKYEAIKSAAKLEYFKLS